MYRLQKIPLLKIISKPQKALQTINKSICRSIKKIDYKNTLLAFFVIVIFLILGKYAYEAYEKHAQQKMDRDFSRGVLAINTDKSIYKAGETVLFQMSSLDSKGDTLCNSDLELVVSSSDGDIVYKANSKSGNIVQTVTCDPKNNVTNEPDYIARRSFAVSGKYVVTLRNDSTGKKAVSYFEVMSKDQDFEISRFGATRVNPEKSDRYAMVIKVKSKYAFNGKIIEKIPTAFSLKWQGNAKIGKRLSKAGTEYRELIWNADIAAGESVEFAYEYSPPRMSPEYYKFGELEILDTEGSRLWNDGYVWQVASDAVNNGGNLIYADYSGTADDLNFRTYSDPTTVGSEFTTVDTSSTSSIVWSKIVAAPTREEKIAAQIMANGSMFILKCTTGCDATADWSQIATYSTVVTGATANVLRPYDIAYEQLSGDFTIVFSDDNTTGSVYYCQYNGSTWTPSTVCGSTFAPGSSNQINMNSLVGVAGQPEWVRLISKGSRLTSYRSDELMVAVSDSADDLFLAHWDGSAWEDASNPTDALSATNAQKFDIAFEETSANNPSEALAVVTNASVVNLEYVVYSGGAWGTITSSSEANNGGQAFNAWVNMANDPLTDDIAIVITDSGSDFELFHWSGSALTDSDATDDTSAETVTGDLAQVAWTRFTSEAVFMYTDANLLTSDMECWQTGGSDFTAIVSDVGTVNISNADDVEDLTLVSAPNNDRMLLTRRGAELVSGTGDDLVGLTYDGAGCGDADWTTLGTLLAGGASAGLEGGTVGNSIRKTHASAYTPYSPWSLNWRFFDDETVNDPSTGLNGAAENVKPTSVDKEEFIRLRINVAERGGMGQTDTRKILQYAAGSASCTPNTVENDPDCTWTNVGDTSETSAVWRYATSGETCSGCADGATSNTPSLTSTTTGDPEVFYVSDKDAAQDTDFDHLALTVREIDFPLKAEDVVYDTTYYFRLYEPRISGAGQGSIVYREQDNDGSNDCAGGVCTYPNLAIRSAPVITVSGTIYQSDESSIYDCSSDNITVYVSTNGGANQSGTCTASDGTYSISTVTDPEAADIPIVVYIDSGESILATTVTLSSSAGANISSLDLYAGRVVVTHEGSTSITNAHLGTADNGNAGIRYAVFAGVLTVSTPHELHVKTGKTFAPGQNVLTDKLHVEGTYSGSTETITLRQAGTSASRPLYIDGGTFTAPSSTVFQGNGDTDVENTTYSGLSLNPNGLTSNTTYNMLGSISVNGDLTINPSSGSANLLTVNAGGTITVGSAYTTSITSSGSASSVLDLRPASTDYSISSGSINIGAGGSIDASSTTTSTLTLTGTSGTLFTRTGTFTAGGSTVVFSPDASVTLTSGTFTFNNLTLSPSISSAGRTYTFGSGALTINGDFNINPSGTQLLTVNMAGDITVANNKTTTITRSSTANSSLVPGASNPALSSGNITVATGGTLNGTGSSSIITLTANATPLSISGTYTPGSTTIAYVPASTTGVNVASTTYYNATFNKASNTFSLQASGITVTNDLVITAGVLDAVNGSNYPIIVGRNWTNSVGSAGFEARAGTVTFNTATTSNITGATTFNNFTASTAGKTILFGDNTTFRVNGLLTLAGSSGPNYVTLNSVSGGTTQWTINHQGTESISYASVTNSACDGTSTNISADDGTSYNGGNNGACWLFNVAGVGYAHWKLDEGYGTSANDISGNSNTGTLAGANLPAWKSQGDCMSNKCLYFEGTTAKVTVANPVDVKTISFWARPNSTSTTFLQFTGSAYISASAGSLSATGVTSPTFYVNGIPTTTIIANKWQHIAMTTGTNISASTIVLGNNSTNFYRGYLDEVKFVSSEYTLAQVRGEFIRNVGNDAATARFGPDNSWVSSDLVGYYKLDESSGNATDSSGNVYTLTNSGTTTYVTGKFANGSEHVPASFQHFSTASTISGVKSVAIWVNPDSTTNYYWSLTSGAYLTSTTGTLSTSGLTNAKIFVNGTESTTIDQDLWQHVVVTFDSIDANQFYVGRQGSNYFDGALDEVRLYTRTLSPGEVRALYNWAPGPVADWKMDENTGTIINDSSGNGNTSSTFIGDVTWGSGKYGAGLVFDGNDDVVRIPETINTDLGATTDSYSVSAWFKTTASANKVIVGKITSVSLASPFVLALNGSYIPYFRIRDATASVTATGVTALNDGEWHYITGVRDTTTDNLFLYIDGILQSTINDTSTGSCQNDDEISIGNGGTSYVGWDFTGSIDDVKVYNYARTPSQIIEDMNGGHPVGGSPVGSSVGYWKLDEGDGTNAQDSSTATNNNDLTLSSESWRNDGKFGLAFNGTGSNWLYRSDDSDFDFLANEDMTISLWFRSNGASTANTEYLVSKESTSAGYAVWLNTGGEVIFGVDDDGTGFPEVSSGDVSWNPDYYDQTWHHFAGVLSRSGTTDYINVYIDGKLIQSSSASGTASSLENTDTLTFASRNTSDDTDDFVGDLDEIKIYRSALTESQIKLEYARGVSAKLGSLSTSSGGAPDDSAARSYCIPGDSTSCDFPVAHYKLEENTDTTANNSVDGSYTGTLTNGPTWSRGKYGSGVNFDGSDDYIVTGNSFNSINAYTVSMWAYLRTTSTDDTFFSSAGSDTTSLAMYIGNGTDNSIAYCNDGTCSGSSSSINGVLTDNAWQHITFTYDGSGASRFYVNGINVTSDGANSEQADTGNKIFGNYDTTNSFGLDGVLDDIRVYNYVRTPAQIAWDYNRGSPVVWYKLDDCSGASINNSAPSATGGDSGIDGSLTIGASGNNTVAGSCTTGPGAWYDGSVGRISSSIELDGTDDYISVSDPSGGELDFGDTDDMSIAGWFKRAGNTTDDVILAKRNSLSTASDTGYVLYLDAANDNLIFEVSDGTDEYSLTSLTAYTDTSWHHFVIVFDESSASGTTMYIDGLDVSATKTGTIANIGSVANAISMRTGSESDGGSYFEGQVDDLRIYRYTLTSLLVKNIYNDGAAFRFK